MEKLLSSLKNIPEYQVLLKALSDKESAAVTGIGQINRSHLIAGLRSETAVPMVVIVQDDIAAKRLQQELKDFLGQTYPVLPHRELTFYDAAGFSRSWEQKRLRQLWELASGQTKLQILTWEVLQLLLQALGGDVVLDDDHHGHSGLAAKARDEVGAVDLADAGDRRALLVRKGLQKDLIFGDIFQTG